MKIEEYAARQKERERELEEKVARGEAQVGAVVTFPPGVTREEAKTLLARIGVETMTVDAFEPEWGSPVWHIP